MKLETVRVDLTAILAATLPQEIGIIDHLPDSVSPPCVFVAWNDPWLKKSTLCAWEVAMEVIAVAQRIEPGGKLETLENVTQSVIDGVNGTAYTVVDATAPYPMQIAGVDYLACSINMTYDMEG